MKTRILKLKMIRWLKKIISTKGNGLINISFINNSVKNVKDSDINIVNNQRHSTESLMKISKLEKSSFQTIDTEIKDYYEERLYDTIKIPNNFFNRSLLLEDEQKTLIDIISTNAKVVLLGNAGVGKTIELKHIFNICWDKRKHTNIFPIYIDLKSFRNTNKIEDYVKVSNWRKLPNLVFILDGLDEVSNVQDVISGLESFITQNSESKVSYLLSCRTNIYEKFLIELQGFAKFYLKPLSHLQSDRVLQNKFGIHLSYYELNKYDSYLENPFHLNLFAQYYLENKSFPKSNAEMWDLIIKNEIDTLFIKKTKKRNQEIDKPTLYKIIEKVAIVNELSQKSYITDEEISEILTIDDKKIFKELPFIERLSDESAYFFIHRNYQEFFAARFISKLSTEKIIDFIQVKNTGKTKPTLFNVISFLLNILKDSEALINWLSKNENEIVFASEPEKIDKGLRNKVFKIYFEKTCIENTFWINNDRKIKIEQLAKFASLDYLLSIIQDNTHLYRTIESAIIVLQNFKIPTGRIEKVKSLLYNLLKKNNLDKTKDEEADCKIKAEILKLIQAQNYHLTNSDFFDKIYYVFITETDKEINHIIISMIKDFNDVDKYFEFIEKEVNLTFNLKHRKHPNETSFGFEYVFEGIIEKVCNENNFLKCVDFVFNPDFHSNSSSLDSTKREKLNIFIKKHKKFFEVDNNYLFRFLDLFITYDSYHTNEDELDEIIKATNSEEVAFNYIFDKVEFDDYFYFLLVRICKENNVNYLIERYKDGTLKETTIDSLHGFRWQLFGETQEEKDLANVFSAKMIEVGFVFKNQLPTDEQLELEKKEFNEFAHWNFNLVFNRDELLKEIKKIFIDNQSNELTLKQVFDLKNKWYRDKNYHSLTNTTLRTVLDFARIEDPITFVQIEELLKIDSNHLKLIKGKIDENKPIQQVSLEQIEIIKNKCKILISELERENYENVIKVDNSQQKSFSYFSKNYGKIKILYFFSLKYFEIQFDKYFYINTLQYSGSLNLKNTEKNVFEHIREQIGSEDEFKLLVSENIKSKNLDFSTLEYHCNYIVEEQVDEFYEFVGSAIIDYKIGYFDKLFEKYVDKIYFDPDFLKKCCQNITSSQCWEAIRFYQKNNNLDENLNDFVSDISLKYLSTKNYHYINTAIDMLFYCNKNNAIEIYWKLISNGLDINSKELSRRDYEIHSFKNYNHFNELHLLQDIFKLIYIGYDFRDFYMARNFLNNLVAHLSYTKIGYSKIKKTLIETKVSLISETEIFHINQLIKTADTSYFNSQLSIPSFQEAKKIMFKLNI